MDLATVACPVVVSDLNLASAATAHISSSGSAFSSYRSDATKKSVHHLENQVTPT
jgi:hypothetical protein